MNIDNLTLETLKEVQHHLRNELKVEMSIEEIADIVNSQFEAATMAFQKNLAVRLPVFGRFEPKHMKITNIKMNKLHKEKANISKTEYLTKHKEIREERLKSKKKVGGLTKSMKTLKEFKKVKTIVNITHKYNKILEDETK